MKLDFKFDSYNEIIYSIVWGFGLAMVFKKVCNNNNCIVINENILNNKNNKILKKDNKCYKLQKQNNSCKHIIFVIYILQKNFLLIYYLFFNLFFMLFLLLYNRNLISSLFIFY